MTGIEEVFILVRLLERTPPCSVLPNLGRGTATVSMGIAELTTLTVLVVHSTKLAGWLTACYLARTLFQSTGKSFLILVIWREIINKTYRCSSAIGHKHYTTSWKSQIQWFGRNQWQWLCGAKSEIKGFFSKFKMINSQHWPCCQWSMICATLKTTLNLVDRLINCSSEPSTTMWVQHFFVCCFVNDVIYQGYTLLKKIKGTLNTM